MDTLANMVQAVQDDLTTGDESTLFPPALIKRAINRSYRKIGALFPWPGLEDAKETTTTASQAYYDYPDNWVSDSIWKLSIANERYGEDPDGNPLTFDDYLNWKEDFPDSTDKKWANQQRRYFVSPTPSASGLVIAIWGHMVTETLSADADITIFSYSGMECNEAIVLEAVAILKSKGDNEKAGEFRSMEAKQIIAAAWGKIRTGKAKYEKNQPSFDVPNFFGRDGNGINRDMTGRF